MKLGMRENQLVSENKISFVIFFRVIAFTGYTCKCWLSLHLLHQMLNYNMIFTTPFFISRFQGYLSTLYFFQIYHLLELQAGGLCVVRTLIFLCSVPFVGVLVKCGQLKLERELFSFLKFITCWTILKQEVRISSKKYWLLFLVFFLHMYFVGEEK